MMKSVNEISFHGESDLGQKRTNNEDAFIAQTIWDDENVLAVVIDGVGGYDGGEIAAAIAKNTIVEYLENFPNGERANLLKQAVIEANNNILKSRSESGEYKNMSCVLTAILVEAKRGVIHMAHIGDTRLYQYHQGKIMKLSHDHSLIGYREEVGELTEEEAMHHPQRNVIGRDVGSKYMEMNTDLVEMETFKLKSDSILLLCSDGLSDMITSTMMTEILSKNISLEDKTKELIGKANFEGGNDNITVVLVQYTGENFDCDDVDCPVVSLDVKNETKTEYMIDNVGNRIKEKSLIRKLLIVNTVLSFFIFGMLCLLLYKNFCFIGTKENISIDFIEKGDSCQIDTLQIDKDSINKIER